MVAKHAHKIIYYDGVCLLCNALVMFIIKQDRKDKFRFIALQSSKVEEHSTRLESVRLIDNGKEYSKSDAIIRIIYQLNYWWYPFFILLIVPKFIRDYFYLLVAKNRYKVFGKAEQCVVPDSSIGHKFIHDLPD